MCQKITRKVYFVKVNLASFNKNYCTRKFKICFQNILLSNQLQVIITRSMRFFYFAPNAASNRNEMNGDTDNSRANFIAGKDINAECANIRIRYVLLDCSVSQVAHNCILHSHTNAFFDLFRIQYYIDYICREHLVHIR